jgi:hypothetical protein
MLYVLTLTGFAAACLLVAHLLWRRFYGINQVFWAKVEICWWLMSFLAATLAAAQFEDKLRRMERDGLALVARDHWTQVVNMFGDINQSGRDDLNQLFVTKYGTDVYTKIRSGINRAWRAGLSDSRFISQPHDIYRNGLDELCSHPVGIYSFSEQDFSHYLVDAPGKDTGFQGEVAIICAHTYAVTTSLERVAQIDGELDYLAPIYPVTKYWYFVLLIGFALKFTKNTSDLIRARRSELGSAR